MSKNGIFSGPYFPVFSPNTGNTDQKETRIWTLFRQCLVIIFIVDWILRAHFFICLLHMITAQKMKISIDDFFSKCDQIRSFLGIWLYLLKRSLMENFIFCAVWYLEIFSCLGIHKWYQRPIWSQSFCYYLHFGTCCLQHTLHQQNILQFRKVLTWTKKWIYLKNCYVKSLQQQKKK